MDQALEKLLTEMTRSSGSARIKAPGAWTWPWYNREYTSSATIQTRCRRQCSMTASRSSALIVQPVGLFGLLRYTSRASSPMSSMSRATSSDQRSPAGRREWSTTAAPLMRSASRTLGHTGPRTTGGGRPRR